MMLRRFPVLLLALWASSSACVWAAAPDEITVSSANYARSSREEIQHAVNKPEDVNNPTDVPVKPVSEKKVRYLFTRGEISKTDLTYQQLCSKLEPVLAQKGFVNAVNSHGRVPDPDKLDLILRVNYGQARWRDPVIRTTDLTWLHGLIPKAGTRGVGLTTFIDSDYRAGGAETTAPSDSSADDDSTTSDQLDSSGEDAQTDDYYLLVVDAFDYHDLLKHRHHSKRLWTTFISIPASDKRPFSSVADSMIAKAAPYFGETTTGKVRFTMNRASVNIGEMKVVEQDVKRDAPKPEATTTPETPAKPDAPK